MSAIVVRIAVRRARSAAGDSSSFVCRNCGKAVEPPLAGGSIPPPPQATGGGDDRWSEGPPEASANRWSAQAPLGDESSSSESVSQTSILPEGELHQPASRASPSLAVGLGVDRAGGFLGGVDRRHCFGPLASALVRRAEGRGPAGHGRVLAGRNWTTAANRPAVRPPRRSWPWAPRSSSERSEHISKDPGDGQRFLFVPGAVRALASTGEEAVPGLCEGLRSPEPQVRAAAVEIVQEMGAAGRGTRDSLLVTLGDPNRWIRYSTIDALGYFGADAEPAGACLAEIVDSPDLFARRHAIEALGRMGPAGHDAVVVLEKAAAEDPDMAIRSAASLALKQVEVRPLAREALRDATGPMKQWLMALKDDDTAAAIAAAKSLGDLGFKGLPAAPGLASMLHHPDRSRRLAAATALGCLGVAAADFTPTLEAATKDQDAEVRAAAAKALEPPSKP